MAWAFEPAGGAEGGAAMVVDEGEVSVLRTLSVQVLELIGPGGGAESADPLDALFAEGPSRPPKDPALARLFPDAYGEPDREQDEESRRLSAEFRRFTERDLRIRKREDLLAVVRSLDALSEESGGGGGALLTLKPDECKQWLGALNDLRLTLASRLDITEDGDSEEMLLSLPDEDPNKPLAVAYHWLGMLQGSLVEAMMPWDGPGGGAAA